MKKLMIAAGGTGGHINPALAFAHIVKQKYPDCEIMFFGSSDRIEATMIPEKGYPFLGMKMAGMNGGWKAKISALFSLWKAERSCTAWLKEQQPDACVGFGNYISVPLILAAKKRGIPTMIHEQNSIAGKANRFLCHFADAVVGSYDNSFHDFPDQKFRFLGNPEATLAIQSDHSAFLDSLKLRSDRPVVFFMMGSLGSSTVSKVIDEAIPEISETAQVVVATGVQNEYCFQAGGEGVRIETYVDGPSALATCSLAVTRAGATTMAEITALGTPSVLIPSPYVPNNHQLKNAQALEREGAAVVLEEKDLTANRLAGLVKSLLSDSVGRETISRNARRNGKPDAAYDMLKWLEELINE